MVDYILVVDCPLTWHTANLQRNTEHYASLLRYSTATYFPIDCAGSESKYTCKLSAVQGPIRIEQ
eukprot:6304914-Pyramimonas_sp.AAC.1